MVEVAHIVEHNLGALPQRHPEEFDQRLERGHIFAIFPGYRFAGGHLAGDYLAGDYLVGYRFVFRRLHGTGSFLRTAPLLYLLTKYLK